MKPVITQEAKDALIKEFNRLSTYSAGENNRRIWMPDAISIIESFPTSSSEGVSVSDGGKPNASANWIPVSERLPEEGTDVLVYQNDNICKASYGDSEEQSGEQVSFYVDLWDCGRFVTHWQPLPKSPPNKRSE